MFTNGPGDLDSIPGRVIPKSQKMLLNASLLNTLSIIRYGSRVKWSNPGKGVAPSHTPWCSSYRKGSLRVTLDKRETTYLFLSKNNYLFTYSNMVSSQSSKKNDDHHHHHVVPPALISLTLSRHSSLSSIASGRSSGLYPASSQSCCT